MSGESPGNEKKIKHLEFIQNAISRMASNSFKVKNWYITVFTATIVLAVDNTNSFVLLASYIPLILFWGLDAYYLQQERRFRDVYDVVVLEDEDKIDFDMGKGVIAQDFAKIAFSKTIWPLYVIPGIVLTVVLIVMLHC